MRKDQSELEDTGERLIVEGHDQNLTYGEHLARYVSVLDITKNKVVLDVACGTGYGSSLIAKTAKKVIGVDNSPQAIKYSKKNYNASNIEFVVGDATQLPLQDQSVDVVVSFETIEHLLKPTLFINEIKRVLKPGGTFIVSTPNAAEFMEGNEYHKHEFKLAELENLLKISFKHVDFWYEGSWFSAGIMGKNNFSKANNEVNLPAIKTFGQPPDKATFFIAVASDRATEQLKENVVIADTWSLKEDLEREKARSENLTRLNNEVESLSSTKNQLEKSNHILASELEAIRNSRGYKLIVIVRKLIAPFRRQ
jgi:SAM-dependent methyltransferase